MQISSAVPGITPATRSPLARVADLIFSTDHKQRRCIVVLMMTFIIMTVGVGVMAYGAHVGIMAPRHVRIIATMCALSFFIFYALIRSGVNQRFADPTLAFPQSIAAQTMLAGIYAVAGPVHAAALLMFAVVMVFGMFNMRAEAVRATCVYTVGIAAAVMIWRVRTDPINYARDVELIYFILLATTLPAISRLSSQMMAMRQRLKSQKTDLQQALERIHDMATRDELTGLPNRRFMMEQLQEHAQRRARGGTAFYIGMVDLDHFKAVNDSYGHAVGDDVLRAFGSQARSVLRNTDLIGRWGGEEFLLVLPESPAGEPTLGVARLRDNLDATQVCASAPHLRVAFSSGFTRYQEGEPIGQAIERADRALYAAKSAGRNRSVVL